MVFPSDAVGRDEDCSGAANGHKTLIPKRKPRQIGRSAGVLYGPVHPVGRSHYRAHSTYGNKSVRAMHDAVKRNPKFPIASNPDKTSLNGSTIADRDKPT